MLHCINTHGYPVSQRVRRLKPSLAEKVMVEFKKIINLAFDSKIQFSMVVASSGKKKEKRTRIVRHYSLAERPNLCLTYLIFQQI